MSDKVREAIQQARKALYLAEKFYRGHGVQYNSPAMTALQDANEKLCAALDEPECDGWVSVEERLPEKRESPHWVWCYTEDEEMSAYLDTWLRQGCKNVTHWMLPEPPKE